MIQDKIFFDEKDPTGVSYNTPFTVYGSYQGRLWSKTPTGSIKYYTQNSDLSVYATTGSNQFSGSQTVTGSLTVTGGITGSVTTASYVEYTGVANKPTLVSSSAQIVGYGIFATTGSNQFNGSQAVTGSLTVTGQVIAQTLNVQQVTSSIVFSSGSNIFGNTQSNTQQFTGSVSVTGSLTVTTTGTELQVTSTGVNLGNALTDSHIISGSLRVNPNGLFVSGSGNVGIGTTNPETLSNNTTLQIDGTNHSFVRTGNSSYGGYFATIPTAEVLCIANVRNPVTGTYNNTGKAASGINLFSESSNGYITFLTTATNNSGPSERMRITSGGFVGIGTTSPTAKLEIQNSPANDWGLSVWGNTTTGQSYGGIVRGGTNSSDVAFRVNNAANSLVYFTVQGNGNVGINTNDPQAKLEIKSGYLRMFDPSSGLNAGYAIEWSSNNGGTNVSYANIDAITTSAGNRTGDLLFRTSNAGSPSERMRITSDGNVGIGTTSPDGRLTIRAAASDVPSLVFKNDIGGPSSAISNYVSAAQTFTVIGTNTYVNSTANLARFDTGKESCGILFDEGTLRFVTGPTGSTASGRMSITSAGIVDISGPLVVKGTLPVDQTSAAVIDHLSSKMRIFSYGASGTTGTFEFRNAAGGAGSNLVATINASGVYTAVSDINKKKDFEQSTIGLNAILGLKPTLYRMRNDESEGDKELGFIAQEVKEFIPQAYVESGEDEEKFIGLNYNAIVATLVKSVQELKSENDTLKSILQRNNIS